MDLANIFLAGDTPVIINIIIVLSLIKLLYLFGMETPLSLSIYFSCETMYLFGMGTPLSLSIYFSCETMYLFGMGTPLSLQTYRSSSVPMSSNPCLLLPLPSISLASLAARAARTSNSSVPS